MVARRLFKRLKTRKGSEKFLRSWTHTLERGRAQGSSGREAGLREQKSRCAQPPTSFHGLLLLGPVGLLSLRASVGLMSVIEK